MGRTCLTTDGHQAEQGESSQPAIVICFNCHKPGHYTTRCLENDRGKAPEINTITIEVQQLATRNKPQQFECDVYDEICQAAKVWIDKANNANVERMQTETRDIRINNPHTQTPSLAAAKPLGEVLGRL